MIAARSSLAAAVTIAVSAILIAAGCSDDGGQGGEQMLVEKCEVGADAGATEPDFLRKIGCRADFDLLASVPLDASIPGARSVKFVVDRQDMGALYFQNSKKYKVHWEFASKHLSGNGKPLVPSLSAFNTSEYYSTARRFLLGSITYYEGPKIWAMEIAPYDTAEPAMIQQAWDKIVAQTYFGPVLYFHPTSADGGEDRRRSAQERAPEDHRRRSTRRSTFSR